MFFLIFQTLMPRILSIDKNHGKTSTPKSEGSCIFWGTVDQCIGQHLSGLSIDTPAAMPAETPSRVRRILFEYRPISCQVVFCCHSRIGRQIDQQSVEVASEVCQQYIGELSVEYRWGISGVSVNNQHHLESVNISAEWCFTVGQVSAKKSTNSRPR